MSDSAETIQDSPPLSRRKFLRRSLGGLAAAAAGTIFYTWRIEPHWVEIVERPLPLAGLPTGLVGKRVVQLSDIHAGPHVDQSYLLRSAERIAELKPDLILLTGDLMTSELEEEVPKAMEVIKALPSAPLGCVAALGNHDYGLGWKTRHVADKLTDELERLDVRVLRNDALDLGGLQLAGVEDLWCGEFNIEQALGRLGSDSPSIVLCHNPDALDRPGWGDYRGYVLAGHTHGGQCKPPLLPPPLLPVNNRRYVAGEYDMAPGRKMYINRGLGHLLRVRFNARPEITVFTLARA